jgi:hypothetical protein
VTSTLNAVPGRAQISAYEVAILQAACITLRAIPVELLFPLHHICLAAIFLDEPADAVATFAGAFGALDTEHIELALDVAEDEIALR